MKQHEPIQEELKSAFFGIFAITLKPGYSVKRTKKGPAVQSDASVQRHLIRGIHNHTKQVGDCYFELRVGSSRIQIPYEAIHDYKRIGDLK